MTEHRATREEAAVSEQAQARSRRILAKAVIEKDFTAQVIDLLTLYKWRVHHCRAARTGKGWRTPVQGHGGFCDIVAVKPGRRVLWRELKSYGNKPTPEQQEWGDALLAAGEDWAVWWPQDIDEIEEKART